MHATLLHRPSINIGMLKNQGTSQETFSASAANICGKCSNRAPRSCEILMFVCLQKGAKQCCDAVKLAYAHCTSIGMSAPVHLSTKCSPPIF